MVFYVYPESCVGKIMNVSLRGEGSPEDFKAFVENYLRNNSSKGAELAYGNTIEDIIRRPVGGEYVAIVSSKVV